MNDSVVRAILRALIIALLISFSITCLAAIKSSNLGASGGEIINSMYVYSIILGLSMLGVGLFVQKKHKLTAKILKILGIYNVVVTAIVFTIMHI